MERWAGLPCWAMSGTFCSRGLAVRQYTRLFIKRILVPRPQAYDRRKWKGLLEVRDHYVALYFNTGNQVTSTWYRQVVCWLTVTAIRSPILITDMVGHPACTSTAETSRRKCRWLTDLQRAQHESRVCRKCFLSAESFSSHVQFSSTHSTNTR